jgi:tetratricopeptide (TPR) repeat protein
MRSDFFGDCAIFEGLPEALNESQYLTPRLTREQRRDAIVGPARVFDGDVAPDLVNRLLNQMGTDPDQLPLMQHLLMRMWTWRFPPRDGALADAEGEPGDSGRELTLADCDAVGGFHQALSRHADEAFAELDDRQKAIAEILFRILTERAPGNRDIRRPTAAGEVAELAGASLDELVAVVETFRAPGRSFIVPPFPEPIDAARILDITHESLIRQWERLRDWAEKEEKSAETYRRLAETASLWQQGESALWQSPDLEMALDWRTREQPTALWAKRYGGDFALAMAFLAESEKARDAREAEASALRQRRDSLRRRTFGTAIAALVVVTMLALFSFVQWREAIKQQHAAQLARDHAEHAVAGFITRLLSAAGVGAIEELDQAINLDPTDVTSYFLRAVLYSADARKDYDHAIADLSRVIELDPGFIAAYEVRGGMYDDKKDYDRAIVDYDQTLKLDPKNALVYNGRGWAYHNKRDYDRAIADYDQAIRLNPNFAMAYNNRCLDYNNKKNYDRAITDCDQAIQLNPKLATAYNNRGRAYDDKKGYDRAIVDYDQAIRLDPNYAIAYSNRGVTYHNKGDYDRAIADYDQAIGIDPNNATSYSKVVRQFFQTDALPTVTVAWLTITRGSTIAPSPTTIKRSGSIPIMRPPTATVAWLIATRRITTAPSPTTIRQFGSIPIMR